MKKHILLIALLFTSLLTHAQVKIGDNPTTINPSSLLELESTNKALLITRVPTANDVNNPVDGMIVYDIAMKCTRAFQDGIWSECLGVDNGGGAGGNTCLPGDQVDYSGVTAVSTTGSESFAEFSLFIRNGVIYKIGKPGAAYSPDKVEAVVMSLYDGPFKEVVTISSELNYALSEDGDVYGWGSESGSSVYPGFGSNGDSNFPTKITDFPEKIKQMWHGYFLGESGTLYYLNNTNATIIPTQGKAIRKIAGTTYQYPEVILIAEDGTLFNRSNPYFNNGVLSPNVNVIAPPVGAAAIKDAFMGHNRYGDLYFLDINGNLYNFDNNAGPKGSTSPETTTHSKTWELVNNGIYMDASPVTDVWFSNATYSQYIKTASNKLYARGQNISSTAWNKLGTGQPLPAAGGSWVFFPLTEVILPPGLEANDIKFIAGHAFSTFLFTEDKIYTPGGTKNGEGTGAFALAHSTFYNYQCIRSF